MSSYYLLNLTSGMCVEVDGEGVIQRSSDPSFEHGVLSGLSARKGSSVVSFEEILFDGVPGRGWVRDRDGGVWDYPYPGRVKAVEISRTASVDDSGGVDSHAVWWGARSISDLGELTAHWLEGGVLTHPLYHGPPESETSELVPFLASFNRAGFVTVFSQPGGGPVSGWWGEEFRHDRWQSAAVGGFVSYQEDAFRLQGVCRDVGLDVSLWEGASSSYRLSESEWPTVSAFAPRVSSPTSMGDFDILGCSFKARFDKSTISSFYPDAVRESLLSAWYFSVVDPVVGRSDVLWSTLGRVVGV